MDHATLIDTYQTPASAARLLRATPIVLLAGITGAGRDTIVGRLVASGEYFPYVTTTTRAKRVNNGIPERDGVEYYFVSSQQATDMIKAQQYVEVSIVHERISGLTIAELQRIHDSGNIGVSDITPDGVEKLKQLSPQVIAIFVVPPSYEAWLDRAMRRYESEAAFWEAWPPRRDSAIRELQDALSKPYYHFVINDNLEDAVEACDKIAHSGNVHHRKDDEARRIVMELLDNIIRRTTPALPNSSSTRLA